MRYRFGGVYTKVLGGNPQSNPSHQKHPVSYYRSSRRGVWYWVGDHPAHWAVHLSCKKGAKVSVLSSLISSMENATPLGHKASASWSDVTVSPEVCVGVGIEIPPRCGVSSVRFAILAVTLASRPPVTLTHITIWTLGSYSLVTNRVTFAVISMKNEF